MYSNGRHSNHQRQKAEKHHEERKKKTGQQTDFGKPSFPRCGSDDRRVVAGKRNV